jgi:flagellum-specific peptidoglycan hydrolase FlgJ
MGMLLENQLTPLTADQAAAALSEGYKLVTGALPSPAILGLLIGQTSLETGNWKKIHNYNFGNVRGESPDGLFTSFRAGEIIDGKEKFLEAGDPKNKFRAYRDAASGAADYIRALRHRPHWWDGLQSGTVDGFIHGLTTYPAYFTANAAEYARVLENRMANYTALTAQYSKRHSSLLAAIGVGVAAGTGFVLVRRYRRG